VTEDPAAVLGVAWAGQVAGEAVAGSDVSGFFGALCGISLFNAVRIALPQVRTGRWRRRMS
jgi:hypothetical protein